MLCEASYVMNIDTPKNLLQIKLVLKCQHCGAEVVDPSKAKGGKIGGKRRWAGVSKSERSEKMRSVALSRWTQNTPAK